MGHSYEEIRAVAIDILANREERIDAGTQYTQLMRSVAEVLSRREGATQTDYYGYKLDVVDSNLFLEVFWELFRQGIITIGLDDSNRAFPFFRLTSFGTRILENQDTYFFHDVSTYENLLRNEIPKINDVTLLYAKESVQAFRVGCLLSATVMLGVATEHTFDLLIETIRNSHHAATYAPVDAVGFSILRRVNKFKSILDGQIGSLPKDIKEDLDTHFVGILSVIRNFRNESGHPSGKLIDREQVYVLLHLFIPYCKKMYALMKYYS